MDNDLRDKLFKLAPKFAEKVIDGWDEKTLRDYAIKQYAAAYHSDSRLNATSFDEDSLIDDIFDYYQNDEREKEYYQTMGFTDNEISQIGIQGIFRA